MVVVVGTCALSHPSSASLLMRMFVRLFAHMLLECVQGRRSDVERCRKGCKAM